MCYIVYTIDFYVKFLITLVYKMLDVLSHKKNKVILMVFCSWIQI
jgi:hypothetical protein